MSVWTVLCFQELRKVNARLRSVCVGEGYVCVCVCVGGRGGACYHFVFWNPAAIVFSHPPMCVTGISFLLSFFLLVHCSCNLLRLFRYISL